jgi:hypothetical protein
MAHNWLKILSSKRLGGTTKATDVEIDDWQDLAIGFFIDFQIDEPWIVTVDAFPFLYELMDASFNWMEPKDVTVVMGEGWELHGSHVLDGYDFRIVDGAQPSIQYHHHLSVSDASLFISLKIGEIISSLEVIEVDVEALLAKFPPHLYSRASSS